MIKKEDFSGHGMTGSAKNELIKGVMEQNQCGKRPLERPETRCEDLDEKDQELVGGYTNWKERAVDKRVRSSGSEMGWS